MRSEAAMGELAVLARAMKGSRAERARLDEGSMVVVKKVELASGERLIVGYGNQCGNQGRHV
jgi:hypothetical protein